MFDNIIKFFKRFVKDKEVDSKETAKERLHLVLMQDRANVSADFLELMKQEIVDVIKKYIDVDETSIDVKLTNKTNGDGTTGAPILYANIPIVSIKDENKNKVESQNQKDEISEESEKQEESIKEDKSEQENSKQEETVEQNIEESLEEKVEQASEETSKEDIEEDKDVQKEEKIENEQQEQSESEPKEDIEEEINNPEVEEITQ